MSKRLLFSGGLLPALNKAGVVTLMMLFAVVCLSATTAYAQGGREIQGTVKDSSGQPVAGAAVVVPGTTVGVSTDADGKFKITMPRGSTTIESSFIGYETQRVIVRGSGNVEIVLQDSSTVLDEAVVVGYGVQRRATVTGSVASVKGKDIMQSPEANLTNTLVGRMPGIISNNRSGQPGYDYSEILIRGRATFNNTQPLFVIDGIANRWGNFDRLNPSDIASITILKDASAAIYGAQAANGVILITTKRGESGEPAITYDGSFSLSKNTRTPKLLNAYEYMNYQDEWRIATGQNPDWINVKDGYLDGTINRKQYGDTDWMKVVFQKMAPKTQHSVSVRGGSERVKYYFSGGFLYQKPVYKDTKFYFRTTQMRSNIDAKLAKDLTINLDMSYRQENRFESNYTTGTLFWEAFHAYPFLYDYYPENGLPGPGIAWGNNIAVLAKGDSGSYRVKDNYFNSKIGVDLKMPWITQGLYFNGYAAFDNFFNTYKVLSNQWDAYRYDANTDSYVNIREQTGDGYIWLRQQSSRYSMYTLTAKLGYERKFNEHAIDAFVAYEQSEQENDWHSGYRRDFYNTTVDYLGVGGDREKDNDGGGSKTARVNFFGRLNYAYKDKYLVEFILRRDGSTNFPKNKRWGWFPGVSVGWRMTEEPFMKNVDFIRNFKLKASVGKMGNDRIAAYQYLDIYSLYNGAQFGDNPVMYQGFTIGRTPNKRITWEEAVTYNVGFESSLFNGMLNFNFDYFYSKRKNILIPRYASIPAYTGMSLPDENLGKIDNKGFEFELMHYRRTSNFTYYVGGTFTFARNKVVDYDEAANIPAYQKVKGYPINAPLLYLSNGIIRNADDLANTIPIDGVPTRLGDIRYKDIDGNSWITGNDVKRFSHSATPEIVYGISLGGLWKGIELNTLFQGQARAKVILKPYTDNIDREYYKHRFISPEATPNSKYPRAFHKQDPANSKASDFWLKSAAFFRLKNLEIAYNFNDNVLQKIGLRGLRISLSGSNLFTIDKIKIQDPETTESGGLYYPQQKIYNIGLSVSF